MHPSQNLLPQSEPGTRPVVKEPGEEVGVEFALATSLLLKSPGRLLDHGLEEDQRRRSELAGSFRKRMVRVLKVEAAGKWSCVAAGISAGLYWGVLFLGCLFGLIGLGRQSDAPALFLVAQDAFNVGLAVTIVGAVPLLIGGVLCVWASRFRQARLRRYARLNAIEDLPLIQSTALPDLETEVQQSLDPLSKTQRLIDETYRMECVWREFCVVLSSLCFGGFMVIFPMALRDDSIGMVSVTLFGTLAGLVAMVVLPVSSTVVLWNWAERKKQLRGAHRHGLKVLDPATSAGNRRCAANDME